MKILVVDDDETIIELLSVILANEGFTDVEYFTSPRAALGRIRYGKNAFDCLMLDIDMPEINGVELCRQARLVPGYAEVPIIMLTALRDENTVRKAMSVGATDYITKPFDVLQLGVRVRVSAHLVRTKQALDTLIRVQKDEFGSTSRQRPIVTRSEIMDIFFADLYDMKRA